jgi:hypothetical protein
MKRPYRAAGGYAKSSFFADSFAHTLPLNGRNLFSPPAYNHYPRYAILNLNAEIEFVTIHDEKITFLVFFVEQIKHFDVVKILV